MMRKESEEHLSRPKPSAGGFDVLNTGAQELQQVWNNVKNMQAQIKKSPRARDGRPLYALSPYIHSPDEEAEVVPSDDHIIKAFVAVARRLRREGNHLQAKRSSPPSL
eukprot:1855291-Rhodomonas_salina.1